MEQKFTFDDVLLLPNHSEVLPSQTDLRTQIVYPLNIPVLSAAMDTVTESRMAIMLARLGGLGVIHKNMSLEHQVSEVKKVKNAQWAFIKEPFVVQAGVSIEELVSQLKQRSIGSAPVVDSQGRVVGIVTRRDIALSRELRRGSTVADIMSSPAVTAQAGASREECLEVLRKNRIEKLPMVDASGKLAGLRTLKDLLTEWPQANLDDLGRLRTAAAVGVGDVDRMTALKEAGADYLSLDSAHGHSQKVIEMVKEASKLGLPVMAGNVATAEAAMALVKAGAAAVKVGMGAGSICTTRVVTGVGVPQLSAVMDVVKVIGNSVPVIADGGIRTSGDIVKALAAGASGVMLGSMLAGTEESPGETITYQGRAYKYYRGMGSLPAMQLGSKDRYFQSGKLTPEGVEARVPYRGTLDHVLGQLLGGLRSGMGYLGAATLPDLVARARFIHITRSGVVENAPHDVDVLSD